MVVPNAVKPGDTNDSPPPPLENEKLDPEGEVYFFGLGVDKYSPLLNENADLDGDVYGISVVDVIGSRCVLFFMHISFPGVVAADSLRAILADRRTLPHIAFSLLFSFLDNDDLPLVDNTPTSLSECGADGDIRILHTVAMYP